ncbi:spore-associated protein A [Streptosporangium sp. NBC_01639]|uniref:spore-associated protein A n=1 Tax=Streptosporangium sp. NBC_01639 TaxID=2975948 RepID=UPI00386B76A0|nr:spore-associated protein A [Streptosporangium sp. NBC_01639]
MSKVKRAAALALGMAATLAASVALSAPAMAASSPAAACGGGSYHVIDSHALGGYATVYLLYNGSTNCVVTWKKGSYAGNTTYVDAVLNVWNTPGAFDAGNYRYYAGPAKAKAPGKCIKWGGAYGSSSYESPWEHCG